MDRIDIFHGIKVGSPLYLLAGAVVGYLIGYVVTGRSGAPFEQRQSDCILYSMAGLVVGALLRSHSVV